MNVTRREFLLQTGQACVGYALGAAAFAAGVERFSLINAAGPGVGLPGAGVRLPRRRQRRQQHGRADDHHRVQRICRGAERFRPRRFRATACCRSRRSASAARSGCIRAWPELQALWTEQKLSVVCNVGPLVQPLTRAALSERRAAALSAVLAFGPGGAVADVDRRPRRADRVGRAHGRPVPAGQLRVPDDHRAVGRHLHARADDISALDCAGADGAQSGAGAERLRHRRRRGRAPQRR